MKKIGLIAGLNLNRNIKPDGVTIRNRNLLKYLYSLDDINPLIIDTYGWRKKIPIILWKIVIIIFRTDKIILSTNTGSAKKLLKILKFMRVSNRIIYIKAGGSLSNPSLFDSHTMEVYEKLHKVFVQSKSTASKMRKYRLDNTGYLPNFKYFSQPRYKIKSPHKTLRCFYLGRIHPDKGIDMIFEALKKFNKENDIIQCDFYGPIDEGYEGAFKRNVKQLNSADYKGVLDFFNDPNAYETLSHYDLFLFPSFWSGEGFPGVVVDAFISGVATLASDWNQNSEVINHHHDGIIFESKVQSAFENKLKYLIDNPYLIDDFGRNAYNRAKNYHTENALKPLKELLYN